MSEEILDNSELTSHKADVSYGTGFSFPFMPRMLALLFLILGFAAIFAGNILGILIGIGMVLLAGFGFSSYQGVDLCFSTGYIREYHQVYFSIKFGKWKSTATYPDISILKLGKSKTSYSRTGVHSTSVDDSKNEIYLMSANHRKRILIKRCNSFEEATKTAGILAEKLNKKVAKFNPQISEKTKMRKR